MTTTIIFALIFFVMIGYYVYFLVVESHDVVNNDYNKRIDGYAETVLSADGEDLYKFSVSENYTMIEADVSINAHATKVMDNIMRLLEEIEIYQILNGNDNWSLNIVTKDFETGRELSNINFPKEEWNLSAEMWDE